MTVYDMMEKLEEIDIAISETKLLICSAETCSKDYNYLKAVENLLEEYRDEILKRRVDARY